MFGCLVRVPENKEETNNNNNRRYEWKDGREDQLEKKKKNTKPKTKAEKIINE